MGIPNERARCSILRVLCRELKIEEGLDFTEMSRLTPGYVGADLSSLVREAAMRTISRLLSSHAANIVKNSTSQADLVQPLGVFLLQPV